jgi:hypothetical protein
MRQDEKESKPKKTHGEKRVRHRSRVERLQRIPKMKEGRLLHDERSWTDW